MNLQLEIENEVKKWNVFTFQQSDTLSSTYIKGYKKAFESDIFKRYVKQYAEEYHQTEILKLNKYSVSVSVCKCDKPILIRTVHPLPDICDYCRKQIIQTEH
jgi:hypothetical protein